MLSTGFFEVQLGAAHIQKPAEGATVPNSDLLVQWDPVDGADNYSLLLSGNNQFDWTAWKLGNVTHHTIPKAKLLPGQSYTLNVLNHLDNTNGPASRVTFSIAWPTELQNLTLSADEITPAFRSDITSAQGPYPARPLRSP